MLEVGKRSFATRSGRFPASDGWFCPGCRSQFVTQNAQALAHRLVKHPVADSAARDQTSFRQFFHVGAHGRLRQADLVRDETDADTVIDEVSIPLLRKVAPRVQQPHQDLQPGRT